MPASRRPNIASHAGIKVAVDRFAVLVRQLREKRGLTRAQLAQLIMASETTIENIEYGKTRPSFEILIALSDVLRASPSYLLSWDEKEQSLGRGTTDNLGTDCPPVRAV